MKYIILGDHHQEYLVEFVNQRLQDGWKLVGGISTNIDSEGIEKFYQAMTKEEE